MTKDEITDITRLALSDRIRAAVKAVLEQVHKCVNEVIEEEMTEHLEAKHREKCASRVGERNGSYQRGLITPVGKIEQLRVPRDRDGTFTTQVLEEYHRATGEVEDALLEMWLQGISGYLQSGWEDRRGNAKVERGPDRQGRRESHRATA